MRALFAALVLAVLAFSIAEAMTPPTSSELGDALAARYRPSEHPMERFMRSTEPEDDDDDDDRSNDHLNVRTGSCPRHVITPIADAYLFNQLGSPSSWESGTPAFVDHLHPNVSSYTNAIAGEFITSGKANVIAVLKSINVDYQFISRVVSGPTNFWRKNAVMSYFVKTQGSLQTGVGFDIKFHHFLRFSPPNRNPALSCKVIEINEFADVAKSLASIPDLFGEDNTIWPCITMAELCNGSMPSFGPDIDTVPGIKPAGKCWLYWRDAPQFVRDDAPHGSLGFIRFAKAKACLSTNLAILQNHKYDGPVFDLYKSFLCPAMGAPIPGFPGGCWPQ